MLRIVLGITAVVAVAAGVFYLAGKPDSAVFPGISGPPAKTLVAAAAPASWKQYDHGAGSAMAILLTDPDSAWLGLAHGLKTIGVPFRITTDVNEALKHKVVLVYPIISGQALNQQSLQALAAFPREGGTLVGFNVAGGGLESVFGFSETSEDRSRTTLRFDTGNAVTAEFTDPRERLIPLNDPQRSANDMGAVSYSQPRFTPLATYDNGSAAILHRPIGGGTEKYPQYQPFVRDAERTENGTVLGELRVSRFLLGHLTKAGDPISFRPGHLQNPFSLPQAMEATGYRYSSTVTANTSLTHLPFRLTYGRETTAQSAIYEFPITIEDEHKPRLGDRLPQALAVADRISRYGGLYVVLIHPNVLDHKLDFQKRLVAALKNRAWFGSLRDFGNWWTARDQITWQVQSEGSRRKLLLESPQPINDLTLQLPKNYRLVKTTPETVTTLAAPQSLLIKKTAGRLLLEFETAGTAP